MTLAKGDVGLGNVDNTSDANKPISNATQAALNDKQSKITANGILKGDGSGNITAASETEVELVSLPNICNPNLLDNWYFGNPVNQRGQTSYTGVGYGIDRFINDGQGGNVIVGDGFVSFQKTGDYTTPIQFFENNRVPANQTVTISAIVNDDLFFATGTLESGVMVVCPDGRFEAYRLDHRSVFRFVFTDSGVHRVKAVKLELGSQQTLAHQENGVWVLNEIPDYGEQLRRCQRYLRPAGYNFIVSNTSGSWYGSSLFSRSEPMRAVPVIVNGDYKTQPIREVNEVQCATITNIFDPNIYGQFTVQFSPLGSTIPNYVYIDATGFNPLLSAEL